MNMKRMRGRNPHRTGGGGGPPGRPQSGGIPMNRNHVFDSSGPEMRVRGTAQQLFEKYLQLGRDATGSGDRVMAEGYFQHAEHYFRIINAMNQAAQQNQGAGQGQNGGDRPPNGHQPYQHNGPVRRADDGGEQDGYEADDQPQPGFYRDPRDQPEPPRAEPVRIEQSRPEHTRPDHARSEHTRSDNARSENGRSENARSESRAEPARAEARVQTVAPTPDAARDIPIGTVPPDA